MLAQFRTAGLVWPTLFAGLGLAVLMTLGGWQWQRKIWKEGLQAQIEARAKAPAVDLTTALARWAATGRDGAEYLRVRLTGTYRHDLERTYYAPGPRALGWHVYTPLIADGGRVVWVNRGFAPDAMRTAEGRGEGRSAEPVEITGLVRAPGIPGTFTPSNEPATNIWYWRDLAGMHASAFAATSPAPVSAPFFVEQEAATGAPVPGVWPRPGVTDLKLANRHLEYALTWWGLAATLIGVYLAFAWTRFKALRQPRAN